MKCSITPKCQEWKLFENFDTVGLIFTVFNLVFWNSSLLSFFDANIFHKYMTNEDKLTISGAGNGISQNRWFLFHMAK